RVAVRKIVESLTSNVSAEFEIVVGTKQSGDVVNELMIGLITLNREIACVADRRLRRDGSGVSEPNDWCVVTGSYVDECRAQSQPIPKLTNCSCRIKMGPGETKVLLLVILVRSFTRDYVLRCKPLASVLPASRERI